MRLRRALDKARKFRKSGQQDAANSSDILSVHHDKEYFEESLLDKNCEQAPGWEQPTYKQSSQIILDSDHLRKNRCPCYFPEAVEADHFKVLRTQIMLRAQEKGWNTVMITSALPGEGKTFTAVNLAMIFSREFCQTVLLVDADLKNQSIHNVMGFESKVGLVDYLIDDMPFSDIMVWPGVDKMTVISGGKTLHDSTELIGSPKMKTLVSEMKSRYLDRYVFFDVPPILGRADALAFAPLVDCIIMVVEAGRTSLRDIRESLNMIPQEKFMGFVMNRYR